MGTMYSFTECLHQLQDTGEKNHLIQQTLRHLSIASSSHKDFSYWSWITRTIYCTSKRLMKQKSQLIRESG